jgi:hypothetical protein
MNYFMKKIFTFLFLFLAGYAFPQTLIVDWDFPSSSADLVADGGIPENLDREIRTEGGTSAIEMKNGFEDKAAQASEWQNGADVKCWVVDFTTAGYYQLTLNSKQSSGGNDPGPKDWKVQYRIGLNGPWMDVPNSDLTVANDWTTGVLDNLPLPAECQNQDLVSLRWIMTSNDNSAGGTVDSVGKAKIDNIVVMGEASNGIAETKLNETNIYPNPASGYININAVVNAEIGIYASSGKELQKMEVVPDSKGRIDISSLAPGIYLVMIRDVQGMDNITRKLVVQ